MLAFSRVENSLRCDDAWVRRYVFLKAGNPKYAIDVKKVLHNIPGSIKVKNLEAFAKDPIPDKQIRRKSKILITENRKPRFEIAQRSFIRLMLDPPLAIGALRPFVMSTHITLDFDIKTLISKRRERW